MAVCAKELRQTSTKKLNKKKALLKKKHNSIKLSCKKAAKCRQYPIHECLFPDGIFELGIGNLVISRALPNNRIAACVFTVDVFCLGVKNALFKVFKDADYEHTLKPLLWSAHPGQSIQRMTPSCAKKLVDGAVAYARDFGFSPHREYKNAKKIFGKIKASRCTVRFVYGNHGKPHYISGAHESLSSSKKIVKRLRKKCGKNGFHYTLIA